MSEEIITEIDSATTTAREVNPGDLVAFGGAVYRTLSYQGDGTLFVEAENIETFERVLLTTAANQTNYPFLTAIRKRRRNRNSR